MRNHLKHFLLLAVLTICFTATAVAQGTVKGKVVDAENKEPPQERGKLPGNSRATAT